LGAARPVARIGPPRDNRAVACGRSSFLAAACEPGAAPARDRVRADRRAARRMRGAHRARGACAALRAGDRRRRARAGQLHRGGACGGAEARARSGWPMMRVLPAPLVSAALCLLWLVLNGSVSAGHVVLAAGLAIVVPILSAPLRPLPVRARRQGVAVRLVAVAGY